MSASYDDYAKSLERVVGHAHEWLESLADRRVPARASADDLARVFGGPLPEEGADPAAVTDLLTEAAEPGLVAMPSGRFFGFVIGGTHPAGLAADWLVSTWDQNSAMRQVTPAHSAIEDAASSWLLSLLGLPAESAVGYVTGGTMANFTCLAAARDAMLTARGWDITSKGLRGAPELRVLVGAERHDTVDLALRYLGLGAPEVVPADSQGRIRTDDLASTLEQAAGTPTIVCVQAGNVHSGAFDDFATAVTLAHDRGAWVHVDGAFGLWAAASPTYRYLTDCFAIADSWATDAHKTLNVPYDCGVAIVADPAAVRRAMGMEGAYLAAFAGSADPHDHVPELSRRGRAVPVWAVLRSLGRRGVADLVDRLCNHARTFAAGIAEIEGAHVLNDVVFTQVCVSFGGDERTRRVGEALFADGSVWMTGSRWRGREILRISVSNWSTSDDDVQTSLAALRRAVRAVS